MQAFSADKPLYKAISMVLFCRRPVCNLGATNHKLDFAVGHKVLRYFLIPWIITLHQLPACFVCALPTSHLFLSHQHTHGVRICEGWGGYVHLMHQSAVLDPRSNFGGLLTERSERSGIDTRFIFFACRLPKCLRHNMTTMNIARVGKLLLH